VGLSITVLGCDGSFAGPGGACSGYLVSSGSENVWLDCGPGTLANVQQHIDLHDLTAMVVSHAHPDHWVELPVAYNALGFYFDRTHVPVYGTAEVHERLEAVKGGSVAGIYDWHTITDGSTFEIGRLRFSCAVTDHPVETLAMRVEGAGSRFVYSADTGPAWSLTALGVGLELALCEATLAEAEAGDYAHLTPAQAGATARDAGAQRLVLTHLPPRSDAETARQQAAEAFGGDVEVATTHLRIEL
jgi:ribonuclease BN (tRNA processing enzyme)